MKTIVVSNRKGVIKSKRIQNDSKISNKKLIFLFILIIIIFLSSIGFSMYLKYKPDTFKSILNNNYESIEWSQGTLITIEELKEYKLKKAYPAIIDKTNTKTCKFYNNSNEYLGSVDFIDDNYLMYKNQIYYYYK